MTYRDEQEALAARNADLEAELAAARVKVAELSGQKTDREVALGETVLEGGLVGTRGFRFAEVLDHEIDAAGYEAIARLLEARLGLRVTQVGSTLQGPGESFRLTRKDGRTEIQLRGHWAALSPSVYSAGFFAGAIGALSMVALLHDVGHLPDSSSMPLGLLTGGLTALVGAVLTQRSMKKRAEQLLRDHRGVVAALLELAEQHRVRPPEPAKVRVEVDQVVERDLPSEEETLGEENAPSATRTKPR